MIEYNGRAKGDRLSTIILYDKEKAMNNYSHHLVFEYPIAFGINNTDKYKIGVMFRNILNTPVRVTSIKLLACPIYTSKEVLYYDDTILQNIPASSLTLRAHAYTNATENEVPTFKEVDVSSGVELNELTEENACYQFIDGNTSTTDYQTQFGSLGVYYDDERCMKSVTFSFTNLVVEKTSECYFIFEGENYSNELGGFAVQLSQDFRAINYNTERSGGIKKMIDGIWKTCKLYFRKENKWVADEIPEAHEDNIETFYPYDVNGE